VLQAYTAHALQLGEQSGMNGKWKQGLLMERDMAKFGENSDNILVPYLL
jgi:hypothetical protein